MTSHDAKINLPTLRDADHYGDWKYKVVAFLVTLRLYLVSGTSLSKLASGPDLSHYSDPLAPKSLCGKHNLNRAG